MSILFDAFMNIADQPQPEVSALIVRKRAPFGKSWYESGKIREETGKIRAVFGKILAKTGQNQEKNEPFWGNFTLETAKRPPKFGGVSWLNRRLSLQQLGA